MAKNSPAGKGHRNGAIRDRSQVSHPTGDWVRRDIDTGRLVDGVRREILFPTEPTTIGHKKIDRAVKSVISRKNRQ
jgi:hypothetical protein